MTQDMTGLEKKVKELIECLYNCEYIGKLTVEVKPCSFTLKLFNSDVHIPAIIYCYQGRDEEGFLDFLKKELEKSNLIRTKHYKLFIYGNHDCKERF